MSYYGFVSECCGSDPDDSLHFNTSWKLGTCLKCRESVQFVEDDEYENTNNKM